MRELKERITMIFNERSLLKKDKYEKLNLELLVMKRKDKYQEHPIEEKALQIFQTNINRKKNILNKIKRRQYVEEKRAIVISKTNLKKEELSE